MTNFVLPIRRDLVGQVAYGAPQQTVAARLNVNENPFPPSIEFREALGTAIMEAAKEINRYPDRDAVELRESLSKYLYRESGCRVSADCVWAANGSNEIMTQILQAFGGPGRRILSFEPTYSMYPEYARDSFTEYIGIARKGDFTIDVDSALVDIVYHEPSVVFIASPNNPTGTETTLGDLEKILEASLQCNSVVVVDEAYAEFRDVRENTALALLRDYPNLIVSRTMSKAFGFAGGRLGYCATASPDIVQALQLVRLPYHLSALSQTAAITALGFTEELLANVDIIRREREKLSAFLVDLNLRVAESDANFILFGTFPNRHSVWQQLLDLGVLIRETGPEGWLRVSVGTPAENNLFREALTTVLAASR